ncbi:MAG: SDR family NAD(P)-dependent oxidoreductase [Pseudomonadota bacterium]
MNKIDLQGKCAVVTGGAQGIGRAIAERFLESGAKVSLWDRDQTLMDETCNDLVDSGEVIGVQVDLTDLAAVEAARDRTNQALGGIDILVNNAGIAGPNAPLWEYPPDAWREVIDIDLNAVFYCCRAVVPQMIEQNYGRICSTASIAGKEGNPTASPYAAAKAGVIALTKALGKELASYDIAVNCITPAAAKTRIFDQIEQEFIDYMLSKIPRGRFVSVDEIAAMVAWLVSAENSFTTGAVFDLSGGRATY